MLLEQFALFTTILAQVQQPYCEAFSPFTPFKIKIMASVIEMSNKIGFPLEARDPFLFGVYHKDNYPAGNEKMEAPRIGNGNDFNQRAEYRMYHGHKIPGFPQHPHRGFETITCTLEGIIDHTDSQGNSGRYGHGDVQWMTAGSGIVHGENFPLLNTEGPNPLRFFQLWINLPKKSKMVKCNQRMFWNEDIPIFSKDGVKVRVWAGEFNGVLSLDAPSDSWAFDRSNNVGIWFITISPSSNIDLPVSKKGINRAIYFINGGKPVLNKEEQDPNTYCFVKSGVSINLENIGNSPMEVLVLQGKPIGEPVVQRGPFVMNTEEEIQQAHIDYRKTGFGKWNKYWSDDAVIFARDKGRFVSINGTTEKPPNNF